MKIVVTVKLLPTEAQAKALLETLERSNECCNWVSQEAWKSQTLRKFDMYRPYYHEARKRFGLTGQGTSRCINKVADSYRTNKDQQNKFRPFAAQPFDPGSFRFMAEGRVSIRVLCGREKMRYSCGPKQAELLKSQKGQVDLMLVRGKWYIAATCDIPDVDPMLASGVLGIDMGIVNIATDNTGNQYSGAKVEAYRERYASRRGALQQVGTKSAKRRLKKIRDKQRLFQKHENHCISKAIVSNAERLRFAIALEDLKGILQNAKASKEQRKRLHNWAFGQLRGFIEYKAKLKGVPILLVDPRNTSRTCPTCGHIDKKNRKKQAEFRCVVCGHEGNADLVAAGNIASKGLVVGPMVAH